MGPQAIPHLFLTESAYHHFKSSVPSTERFELSRQRPSQIKASAILLNIHPFKRANLLNSLSSNMADNGEAAVELTHKFAPFFGLVRTSETLVVCSD